MRREVPKKAGRKLIQRRVFGCGWCVVLLCGLYSETAMRKAKSKNTVYSRHQGLKRASHQTKNTNAWSRRHAGNPSSSKGSAHS